MSRISFSVIAIVFFSLSSCKKQFDKIDSLTPPYSDPANMQKTINQVRSSYEADASYLVGRMDSILTTYQGDYTKIANDSRMNKLFLDRVMKKSVNDLVTSSPDKYPLTMLKFITDQINADSTHSEAFKHQLTRLIMEQFSLFQSFAQNGMDTFLLHQKTNELITSITDFVHDTNVNTALWGNDINDLLLMTEIASQTTQSVIKNESILNQKATVGITKSGMLVKVNGFWETFFNPVTWFVAIWNTTLNLFTGFSTLDMFRTALNLYTLSSTGFMVGVVANVCDVSEGSMGPQKNGNNFIIKAVTKDSRSGSLAYFFYTGYKFSKGSWASLGNQFFQSYCKSGVPQYTAIRTAANTNNKIGNSMGFNNGVLNIGEQPICSTTPIPNTEIDYGLSNFRLNSADHGISVLADRLYQPPAYYEAFLQNDGNFVIYHVYPPRMIYTLSDNGKSFYFKYTKIGIKPNLSKFSIKVDWSDKQANPWDSYLKRPVWQTNTANMGATRLVMQNDGNLVLYDMYNRPVWCSYTWVPLWQRAASSSGEGSAVAGNYVMLKKDGKLAVYSPRYDWPMWESSNASYSCFNPSLWSGY